MATPTAPDLTGLFLPFAQDSFWVAGDYDPVSLVAALKAQPALADFADAASDMQSAVRLDADEDPANVGYWVTVPKGTAQSVIDAGVAAYAPPAPTLPNDPLVSASVAVKIAVTAAIATVATTSPNLTADQKAKIETEVTQQVQAVADLETA